MHEEPFILPESNVSLIHFKLNNCETRIKEGSMVETNILGENTLYQVVNGITKDELNQSHSSDGFMCVIAQKLGHYNLGKNELEAVNWTPRMYEPVYLCNTGNNVDYEEIANDAIGRLPETDMKIQIKDINALVTHNTAILGILGVGKSCLTFELIKKIVASGTKVICLDITNQYASEKGLYQYLPKYMIKIVKPELRDKINAEAQKKGAPDIPQEWGNSSLFIEKMGEWIELFFKDETLKVLVINPDDYHVTKAATTFKIASHIDVSLVEKVQMISEEVLKSCMNLGQTDDAMLAAGEISHPQTNQNDQLGTG